MSTDAQIAANRANSQHSTGPKTADGKAASCLNHFQTGLTGSAFSVLSWEDEEEYDMLRAAIRAQLDPRGPFEQLLVERMAQHQWLSLRALALQTTCFRINEPGTVDEKRLALFIRYQTTHDRAYHRLFNDLLKLRAEARKTQLGFESQKREAAVLALRESAEKRRSELHEFAVLLAEAKADHQITLNSILEFNRRHAAAPRNHPTPLEKAA